MLLEILLNLKRIIFVEMILPVPALLAGVYLIGTDMLRLIKELEKIVSPHSASSGNFNLQDLLFLRAIKADTSNVMLFIYGLDNFDGPAVGKVAVEAQLYEEAFAILKMFNLNVEAVNVLS